MRAFSGGPYLEAYLRILILGALILVFLVLPAQLAQMILEARVYFGTAPMFLFSVAIYLAQGLIGLYLFRSFGISRAIGYCSVLLVASYSTYELAFKLTFPIFGPSFVEFYTSYEVYPTLLLTASICTVLAIRDRLHPSRSCLVAVSLLVGTWILWLASGSFPVRIQAYEANPDYIGLLYNYSTKLLNSASFVLAVRKNQ